MSLNVARVCWALTMVSGLLVVPALGEETNGTAAACDAVAANPNDPAVPKGTGVAFTEVDAPAAIAACQAAVDANPTDPKLIYQLARAHDVAEQFDKAIPGYRAAAEQGYTAAQNALGTLYDGGYGMAADPVEAARLYQLAVDAGMVVAMENLAKLYEDGRGVAQDYKQAAALYQRAADAGSTLAIGNLGWYAESGFGMPKDEVKAVERYKIAAAAGEAFAQHDLGNMYADGRGGLAKDDSEAFRWFKLAADQNWAPSLEAIAWHYGSGRGVPKDIATAERYFRRALAEGDDGVKANARNNMAWMFATENIRLPEAEQLAREAVAADAKNGNFVDTLAWILHLQGKSEEALPHAEEAVRLDGNDPEFAEHLAAIRTAAAK